MEFEPVLVLPAALLEEPQGVRELPGALVVAEAGGQGGGVAEGGVLGREPGQALGVGGERERVGRGCSIRRSGGG
ncbi:hypothetical protein OG946_20085 [Streptomyces sp. NBC_01808]|uniref:hypothetical protein n=1 Tax=Streptomyces sp. NBC_01808 TaxID=2975947 RepID=UPI002DDBB60B|nr:hypothetical protein [Streptomyces sp. NBC_01808]WSA39455.1 hypothetical protein OG946_20085 [Streptomyces sp. NBC_01808]